MELALSDSQLRKLSNSPPFDIFEPFNPNIITYSSLENFGDIDDILSSDGTAIILFQEQDDNTGHWIGLFKNGDTIHFYDSYGGKPDLQKNYLSGSARERYYQKPLLGGLMIDSPYKLDYNDQQVQKDGTDIATCGRHNIVRMWCRGLDNEEYIQWLRQRVKNTGLNKDEIVVALTNHLGF